MSRIHVAAVVGRCWLFLASCSQSVKSAANLKSEAQRKHAPNFT